MAAFTTRTTDAKGRLTLGKEFAGKLVIVRRIAEGIVQITRAQAVPEAEAWLYRSPEALKLVMEGIEDAKAGRLTSGPDLSVGADLLEALED